MDYIQVARFAERLKSAMDRDTVDGREEGFCHVMNCPEYRQVFLYTIPTVNQNVKWQVDHAVKWWLDQIAANDDQDEVLRLCLEYSGDNVHSLVLNKLNKVPPKCVEVEDD